MTDRLAGSGARGLRGAGFAAVTVPSVALAHLAVTGALPPAALMLLVTAVAVLTGMLGSGLTGGRLAPGLLAAQLGGHVALFLALGALGDRSQGCLPVMGRGAEAGVRLALFRADPGCATGYGAGPATATLGAVLLVATAVLLGQVLAATAGALLLRAVGLSFAAVRALVALVALLLPRPVVLPAPGPQRVGPRSPRSPRTPRSPLRATPRVLRGPPVLMPTG